MAWSSCSLYENATYEYTVEAWPDTFRGWQHEFATKFEAGISDLKSEALEGAALVARAAHRVHRHYRHAAIARAGRDHSRGAEYAEVNRIAHSAN